MAIFKQYSYEPYIAVDRFINKYLGLPEDRAEEYASRQSGDNKSLVVMETQLDKTAYIASEGFLKRLDFGKFRFSLAERYARKYNFY